MADKGLELLSTLLQTVGGASQGVRQNEDGSKQYGLVPMLSGMATNASAMQDQKLAREAQKFQLEEAKRESQRRQEEWELNKQDRAQQQAQAGFAYSEKLKQYDAEKKQAQIESNKAALVEEGRTGKVQPRRNLTEDAFVPYKDPVTGVVSTKKSAAQELEDRTTAQALNNENVPQTDLQVEGTIKDKMANAGDVLKNTALAGPVGFANGFFLTNFLEDKQVKETHKVGIDPVTNKPNFNSLNSKKLTVLSVLSNQEGNSMAQYQADIREALKNKSAEEVQNLGEMQEITDGLKQLGAATDEDQAVMMDQYQAYLDRGKEPIKPKDLYSQILGDLKTQVPAQGPQMALIAKAAMLTTLKTLNGELYKMNIERAPKKNVSDSGYVVAEKAKLIKQQGYLNKARNKSKQKLGLNANQPYGIK